MEVPHELDGARVLKYAVVTSDIEPTGATRHVRGGAQLGPATALAIAQYGGDPGYYLFYLDGTGNVATDTYHASLEGAIAQAGFEYRGLHWEDGAAARDDNGRLRERALT
jgi:hypothetical protein